MSASPSSQPVPGTVLLVDLAGTLNVKHRDGGGKEASDIVLLPQPTSDVNDPLNWSRRRKLCNALILFAYVISANMMACLLSSALLLIEKDTGIKLEDLNTGTSIEFLFFGWSNVLWQPLALHFGRRPVLLFTMLVMVTCSVWTPFVTSTGEWYVNRFLLGFFYGPVETLMEICLSDTRFVHERGFWVGLYTWILLGSTFLASAPAGYIAEDLGWEWIQFIAAMMGMATFFIIFFFWDETMFYREHEAPEMMAGSCESRKPTSPVADEAAPIPEKRGSSMKHSQDASSTEMSSGDVSMVPKPYIQRLKFWGSRHPNQPNHLFQSMWMPFYLARFPAIVGSAFVVGAVLSWYTVLSGTTALILSAEPYNFSAKSTGVFLVSGFIGCSVGCVLAAPSANRLAVWLSRRNAGVFEPEYRLWTAIALMILHPTGCILVGVGANHCIHWVGIAFGVAMIVACFSIGSTLAINYIMDCYGEVASDGLVTMGCIRNLIGFAFGYGITPWINATGVQDTYIAIGFIGMALYGVPLIFVWCGKSLREKTAAAYWRTIERNGYVAH